MITTLKIMRQMGLDWTLFRLQYELNKKMGFLEKKFPPHHMTDYEFFEKTNLNFQTQEELHFWWKQNKAPFFFLSEDKKGIQDRMFSLLPSMENDVIKIADEICENNFLYFSNWNVKFEKINWHINPVNNIEVPKVHWVNIKDLENDFGDIKYIWELSRFPFVYTIVRAFILTNDDKYPAKYWELFENWIGENPAEIGVNYKCGQEMTFRIMAWIFGLYAFISHKETTPDRMTKMLKMIYCHADHIDRHYDFALKSVRNNHSISEAAGMYTVGLLFPFFDKASRWKEKGKKYLEEEGLRQVYSDGTYLQHSMNYQRLVVQVYTWVFQLAKKNNDQFSDELHDRLKKCALFLYNNQDDQTGKLPNYGMNDGALIHPLASNDYLDYRPQLNALWYVLTGKRLYLSGIHEENLLWLCGIDSLSAPIDCQEKETKSYPIGGYYTIREKDSFGMIRCTTFKDRPAQADMLHLDLWWKGQNVLTDAGTFSYNTDIDQFLFFNGTSSHNTLMINNKDQMDKAQRFIWLNWIKSKLLRFYKDDSVTIFEGEHSNYSPLIHRRSILHKENCWIIVDDMFGDFQSKNQNFSLRWLFGVNQVEKINQNTWGIRLEDEQLNLKIFSSQKTNDQISIGATNIIRGWKSLYYGIKEAAPQLELNLNSKQNTRIITVITTQENTINYSLENNHVQINDYTLLLFEIGDNHVFKVD
ncbi:alginate lyase family protein [Cytobacillus dafuensis]|uniref:Heparinase n=1 Tax=Cytobacillus dafuensis TaxID=1742359 RepID=A0A5B8ZBW7_CYTDA|nr:alginate lyase family protein [Cytobacillus dafuensis]QED49189.1 heparinase [Cytobacillus dafuensis]